MLFSSWHQLLRELPAGSTHLAERLMPKRNSHCQNATPFVRQAGKAVARRRVDPMLGATLSAPPEPLTAALKPNSRGLFAGYRRTRANHFHFTDAANPSARTLRYLAEHPGSSSRTVGRALEIRHDSQTSTLLHRLQRDGLLTNQPNGTATAWTLTEQGREFLDDLPAGVYV